MSKSKSINTSRGHARPEDEEVRDYILAMVGELVEMAENIQDQQLASALRQVLRQATGGRRGAEHSANA